MRRGRWLGCLFYKFFFFQAEDGIRYLVRSRGLGDVYKRQGSSSTWHSNDSRPDTRPNNPMAAVGNGVTLLVSSCLLYTSDAADERSSVDLGGRRIIKKKRKIKSRDSQSDNREGRVY